MGMSAGRSDLLLAAVAFLAWAVFAPPSTAQDTAQNPTPATPETASSTPQRPLTVVPNTPTSGTPTSSTTTTSSNRTASGSTTPASRKPATEVAPANPASSEAAPSNANPFVLVVHAKNEIAELEASRISKMFLKKVRRWANNDKTPVEPVDQAQDSTVREAFTQVIHENKDLFAIKTYWQRMIFSGRMAPPPELRTDQEILAFVRSRRGAIGYVSRGTPLGDGVKELKISLEEK